MLDEAFRISPTNVSLQIYRALVHLHLGESLTAAGAIDEARRAYLASVAISEPSLKLGHASLLVMFMRANERLALNAVAREHRAEALAFAGRVLEIGEHPLTDAPSARVVPRARSAMGLTLAALAAAPCGSRGPGGGPVLAAQGAGRLAGGCVRSGLCAAAPARDARSRRGACPARRAVIEWRTQLRP